VIPGAKEYHINPSGDWSVGGFDADAGLTGRKIIIDNYGPEIVVGGGAFSGKDPSKVDRSGAYMARRVAVDYLEKYPGAQTVLVKLAYAIGHPEALMAVAIVDGVPEDVIGYDLTPSGIKSFLQLDTPIYADTAAWGHFGRGFSWK
jgi:S-adenosylmethionine synthetase